MLVVVPAVAYAERGLVVDCCHYRQHQKLPRVSSTEVLQAVAESEWSPAQVPSGAVHAIRVLVPVPV